MNKIDLIQDVLIRKCPSVRLMGHVIKQVAMAGDFGEWSDDGTVRVNPDSGHVL